MSLLSKVPASASCSLTDTGFREARGVSMLQSRFPILYGIGIKVVRPPGFEPGTRGWKPLVITPSLQALGLSGHMPSLNRFGELNDLKSVCLHGYLWVLDRCLAFFLC